MEKEATRIKQFAKHFGIASYSMGIGSTISPTLFYWFDLDRNYWILALVIDGVAYQNIIGRIMKRKSN